MNASIALNSMFEAFKASLPQQGTKVVYFPGKKKVVKGELISKPGDGHYKLKLETGEVLFARGHLWGKVNYIGGFRTEAEYAIWLQRKNKT